VTQLNLASSEYELECCHYAKQAANQSLKKKLHGPSPRANYTGRVTADCWRSDFQLFEDVGCHVDTVTNSYGRILGFLDRSRYFSTK
jgi:hypothetical protein